MLIHVSLPGVNPIKLNKKLHKKGFFGYKFQCLVKRKTKYILDIILDVTNHQGF